MRLNHTSIFQLKFLAIFACLFVLIACGEDEPVIVIDPPTAAFTSTVQDNGLTVVLQNNSERADSLVWDFGDGNTSTESNPTHTYSEDGTYVITLTVFNVSGMDITDTTIDAVFPRLRYFLSGEGQGKSWIPIREDAVAYHLGPNDNSWTYSATVPAPWFSIGDIRGADNNFLCDVNLSSRKAMANDTYTFNGDGTYNVDWANDFWGEFGIWIGTEHHETNIAIEGESLPLRSDGVDVSSFISNTQDYLIDEEAGTLSVIGEGAHILNPRYKTDESSYDVGNGVIYTIHDINEGEVADTLVLMLEVFDNDFGVDSRQYFTFASYKGDVPPLRRG